MTFDEMICAIEAGRVFVQTGRGLFMARLDAKWSLPDGEWIIRVRARDRTIRFLRSETSNNYIVTA